MRQSTSVIKDNSKYNYCFLLGIMQRTGTNYLFRLLSKHEDIICQNLIKEDYFIYNSNLLIDYTHKLKKKWNPNWNVKGISENNNKLNEYVGEGIKAFIRYQLNLKGHKSKLITKSDKKNIILSKTPSLEGIENTFKIFPEAKLIIIIRDGRNTVESIVRSFNWKYESSIKHWNHSALKLINFINKNKDRANNIVTVKYEDLVLNKEKELRKIFRNLNLDEKKYDFLSSNTIGVIGSSDQRYLKKKARITWDDEYNVVNRFDFLNRYDNWSEWRHKRFNWIAMNSMAKLGYSVESNLKITKVDSIRNYFLDIIFLIKKLLVYLYLNVRDKFE